MTEYRITRRLDGVADRWRAYQRLLPFVDLELARMNLGYLRATRRTETADGATLYYEYRLEYRVPGEHGWRVLREI